MNRKTSTFTLMLLAVAIVLIPSVYAEYPIENMKVVQDLPDTMIAGNSYEMIITFDNVAKESVPLTIHIMATGVDLNKDEVFIDKAELNGDPLECDEVEAGFFTTDGVVGSSSHNRLNVNISTAINLMPGDYTFKIDLLGEEMTEPEPPKPSPPRPSINILPIADAGPNQTVDVGQFVEFSGANSTDPDGYLTSWTWDFGDGTEASGVNVSHRYLMGGNYTVTLTVMDVRTGEDTDTCKITVKEHVIPVPPLPPFLDNLTITPAELELGDNVTISLDIMNPNDGAISYGFDMEIGELILNIWVDLEAYESKTASRTITPTAIGTYNVTVHGMTGNFTVNPLPTPPTPPRPAEFEVTNLIITPEEVEPGDEVTISVLVTNIGEETGDYTITLDLPAGPYLRLQETVSLEGGESERVEFEVSRDIEGTYTVTVNGLTGSFQVKAPLEPEPPEPAKFAFSNLEIIPDENLTITISVNATNDGEETGSYTVKLKLDGIVIDSEEVTIEGGDSITTSFEVTRDEGTYTVEVEGLTGTFTIAPTQEPPFWMQPGYIAGIVIVVTSAGAVIYYIWKSKILSTIFSNPT